MKNRATLILLSLILLLFSVFSWGCKKRIKSSEDVINHLKSLRSYSADVNITIKNDRQELLYECKQFYDKIQGYRLEIGSDRVQVYKDNKIYVADKKNGAKYILEGDFDQTYSLSFIGKYIGLLYTNETIKYSVKEMEGNRYQVIELLIPGNNRNIHRAEMYINTKTYLPERVIVYDQKNTERILINYKELSANEEINKELFKVD